MSTTTALRLPGALGADPVSRGLQATERLLSRPLQARAATSRVASTRRGVPARGPAASPLLEAPRRGPDWAMIALYAVFGLLSLLLAALFIAVFATSVPA